MQRRILSESVKQWSAQPRTEGRVEGRAEGQAEVVRRQAARKYGAGMAERLAVKRAEIPSLERTGKVGECRSERTMASCSNGWSGCTQPTRWDTAARRDEVGPGTGSAEGTLA